jgi:homoserine O-acetyltransferase
VISDVRRCPIGDLELDCGERLPCVELNLERYGRLNAAADNAVLVCHSLTKGAHAAGPPVEGGPAGWWDGAIGPGKMLDTDELCVICADALGAGRSTSPATIDARTGRPYGLTFPVFTVRDIARALKQLLVALGIGRVDMAIGGCFGGMQVLELAILAPEAVANAVVIATTPATSAHSIAIFSVMRHLIRSDRRWNGGDYYDGALPERGLRDAVIAAMPLWMSRQTMEDRFGRATQAGALRYTLEPEFEVEAFMDRVGRGVGGQIDPNSLLYLTRAAEYFDLVGEHGGLREVAQAISARTLLVSYRGDWRYPAVETDLVHQALAAAGRDVRHIVLGGPAGHGGFMYDADRLAPIVSEFRRDRAAAGHGG